MVQRREPINAEKNDAPSRLGSGGNRPNSRHGADFRLLSGTLKYTPLMGDSKPSKLVKKGAIQSPILRYGVCVPSHRDCAQGSHPVSWLGEVSDASNLK
jgi:hypothetical protein